MAKIWRERLDPGRHRDFMSGAQDAGGIAIDPGASDGWVYLVRECDFTFQFANTEQIRQALAYFSEDVHSPNLVSGIYLEHYWQLWFERLPPGLSGGSKRTRIAKALRRAVDQFVTGG
jgi:hypothetical protein